MTSMKLHWIATPWPVHRPALPTVSPMKYASNIWPEATHHCASIWLSTLSGLSVFPLAVIRRSLPSGRIATDSQKLDNASHHLIEICTFRMRTIL